MGQPTLQDQISAATAYETLFVPALFAQWAPMVAEAARIRPGQRVLDVACGTGVLAREVASRVGPSGHVVGIDPSPGMISVARQRAATIEWREGVAERLPFPDQSFDAVVSQFGLMFFTDPNNALREMLRVLAPGGQLAIAVWDAVESMPAYQSETALLDRLAGPKAAAALRLPFALGDVGTLAATFSPAGVTSVDIATHRGTANFPSIRSMVEADLRGWLPVMGVNLTEDLIRRILEEAETVLGRFATADGRGEFQLSAHLATSSKP
jgi:SAM-dependent methyltransferase